MMEPGSALETNGATIRNAYFAISSSHGPWGFPVPGMLGLVNTTFEGNFIGIHLANGQLAINKFINNTFAGLYDQQIYHIGPCSAVPPAVPGVPFTQNTYCGIYFDGSFNLSGNAYLSLPPNSFGNVFKDLQAGIVAINGTTNIRGCRFENIRKLLNNTAAHQSTAVTFIDNIGGGIHRLVVDGVGKNSTATVHNAERGIYALTSQPMTQVYIANCRMTEVQNGMLLDEGAQGAMGNFNDVGIRNNYVGCTRYFNTIQAISSGIDLNDPNTLYSNVEIVNNEVIVDQPEGFIPVYNPALGLTGIQVTAMTPQAPNALMALQIGGNTVEMPNGLNGIRANNVSNAVIYDNVVTNAHLAQNNLSDIQIYGIKTTGGINNSLECNQVSQDPNISTPPYYGYGLYLERSVDAIVEGNKIEGLTTAIAFVDDNGTNCIVSSNELNAQMSGFWGLFYGNALTGPQYLKANEWVNTFMQHGAQYKYAPVGSKGYTHCQSLYHVSPAANVGGSSANTIDIYGQPSGTGCTGNWFTVLNQNEYSTACGTSAASGLAEINEADTDLAGGGTNNLSAGFKWSTEINLYRKFTENPVATAQEPIAAAFQQSRSTQAVGSVYGVRKGMNLSSAVTASLAEEISSLTAQIKTSDSLLQAFSGGLPGNLAAWTNLRHQTDSLAVLWTSLQAQATGQINAKVLQVSSDNGAVVCNDQPCILERYLNDLYLQTRVLTPRPLTQVEVATVGDIAGQCPQDAGSVV
ncbi:MAG TPA: hypothetical protein PKD78_07465, partial [Saprospiraceae bacterium]|nr:hypothetical protein [Saprospiraceae bacterium]